jgi:hypothetical protein
VSEVINDDNHFIILTSTAFDKAHGALSDFKGVENIFGKWLNYPEDISQLNPNKCVPKLKEMID